MSAQVLFVDDDQLLLASLSRCLQERYELKTFDSAVKALDYLETDTPAPVVVTDMRMPVMDGAEFIVKAKQIAPSTRFLMLTGTPSDQQRVGRTHGDLVSCFINKPCSPSKIAEAIDQALAAHESDVSA